MATSILTRVAKLAEDPPVDLDAARAKLAKMKRQVDDFLPMEEQARTALLWRIHELEGSCSPLMERGYKPLSLVPLTWRKPDGTPKLALFSPTQPYVSFAIGQHGNVSSDVGYPEPILVQYADLRSFVRHGYTITLRAAFGGVVPPEVRAVINEPPPGIARTYLLAEAKWTQDAKPVPAPIRRRDPLLLGWDNRRLWLMAKFDLTPLEEYVAKEFPD